jgi:hypothetical protein
MTRSKAFQARRLAPRNRSALEACGEKMKLTLSREDQEMLRGDHGAATKIAMSILTRMAELAEADELYSVSPPLVALDEVDFAKLCTNDEIQVLNDGGIIVQRMG